MEAQLPRADNYVGGEWISNGHGRPQHQPGQRGRCSANYSPGSQRAGRLGRRALPGRRSMKAVWAASPRLRAAVLFRNRRPQWNGQARDRRSHRCRKRTSCAPRRSARRWAPFRRPRYYAGLACTVLGRTLETAPGNFSMMNREPAGVAAIIVPWERARHASPSGDRLPPRSRPAARWSSSPRRRRR